MQIAAFQTFLAIVSTGSFHAAAAQLNVTQTAVSARIRTLEAVLDVRLFRRGPGGTRLTAAGEQFRPHAEQMLRTWAFISADLAARTEDRVSLRMGVQLSLWDPLLVDVAVWLEREQGKVPFTLNYDHGLDMAQAVEQRLLDLAIVNSSAPPEQVEVIELPSERLWLVADHMVDLSCEERPLFINLEFGPEYDAQLHSVIPQGSRQHIVLGNAAMGLRYLFRRGGMGYFPASMVFDAVQQGRLFRVRNAPEMHLACKILYLPDNPALPQIEEVVKGVRVLRETPTPG